jgi:hypothetical protein
MDSDTDGSPSLLSPSTKKMIVLPVGSPPPLLDWEIRRRAVPPLLPRSRALLYIVTCRRSTCVRGHFSTPSLQGFVCHGRRRREGSGPGPCLICTACHGEDGELHTGRHKKVKHLRLDNVGRACCLICLHAIDVQISLQPATHHLKWMSFP